MTSPGSFRNARLQFERLVFFSDAVFAIAITLLVLDLRLPLSSHGEINLGGIGSKVFGFALSFSVIGIYWLSHHRLFGELRAEDRALRVANLFFLASIVFLPFPTSVIAQFPATTVSVVFYASSVSAVGLLLGVLVIIARRPQLLRPPFSREQNVRFLVPTLSVPAIFIISAVVALTLPGTAMQLWWLIAPTLVIANRVGRTLERRALRSRGEGSPV